MRNEPVFRQRRVSREAMVAWSSWMDDWLIDLLLQFTSFGWKLCLYVFNLRILSQVMWWFNSLLAYIWRFGCSSHRTDLNGSRVPFRRIMCIALISVKWRLLLTMRRLRPAWLHSASKGHNMRVSIVVSAWYEVVYVKHVLAFGIIL